MASLQTETATRAPGSGGGLEPTQTAIGTWGGGAFLPFGVRLEEERLTELLRPDAGVRTVLSADVYGCGEADAMLGRALAGVSRDSYCLIGAVGHDFYAGSRVGRGGFQRFTDPQLRGPEGYAGYLRMATERSLERCGVDSFDVLLLHNPDRLGYTSEAVWEGMRELRDAGLCRRLGIAPGPDNGFVLDQILCLERFGEAIDWAMLILNPFEPWPVEHVLGAVAAHDVKVITRVVDHGGVFWGDVRPGHRFPPADHRTFRPPGWVEAANEKLERLAPIGERHGLTPLQLACAWNLSHEAVACLAPTLLQELGAEARPVEDKRAELAAVAPSSPLSEAEVEEIRRLGDNTGSVPLKGGSRQYAGVERADQWQMTPQLEDVARRWGIEPDRDLYFPADPRDMRERGARRAGVPQALDRRLYMQLLALNGVADADELVAALGQGGAEGVVYESATEPGTAAVLLLDGDPGALLDAAAALATEAGLIGAEPLRELAMYGRTYGSGHEPELEDWLLHAPRRKLAAAENEWAVWYPLRRSADFYRLDDAARGRIMAEHGKVGRTFVEAGYADDVRLECFGLDPADNEFVIGLLGGELDRLSRLVKAMRLTEHTTRYIERLGPFFVGRRAGHTLAG